MFWPEPALICDREEYDFGPYPVPLEQFYRRRAKGGYTTIDHVRESKRHGEECAAILASFLRGVPMPAPHRPWWASPRRR